MADACFYSVHFSLQFAYSCSNTFKAFSDIIWSWGASEFMPMVQFKQDYDS